MTSLLEKLEKFFHSFLNALHTAITNLTHAIKEHKILAMSIFAGSIALALLFYIITPTDQPQKQAILSVPEKPIKPLVDDLMPPEEPGITTGYAYHFEPKTHWDEKEAKEWFVPPNGTMVEELKNANATLINDILGDVP
ncbi:MAG: hypothetical protein ACRC4W_01185 [Treponemataceae bacterium]